MPSRIEIDHDTVDEPPRLQPRTTRYLASWDNMGLECLINLTAWDKAVVWSALSDRPPTVEPPPLGMMLMRAQANLHRRPEIVTFTAVDDELPEETLRELFRTDPQVVVDAIRERCTHHFDGRTLTSDTVIR